MTNKTIALLLLCAILMVAFSYSASAFDEVRESRLLLEETSKEPSASQKEHYQDKYKPKAALAWSLSTTAASLIIGTSMLVPGIKHQNGPLIGVGLSLWLLGLGVCPSLGHFYSDNHRHAWIFLGIRTALPLAWLGLTAILWANTNYACVFVVSGITGAIVLTSVIAMSIHDLITAPQAARNANKKIKKDKVELSFTPTILSTLTKKKALGLALLGRF
ncbi:MAG: hypothetical protein GY847_35370 [Proteobacteria bacterium]|nr:hypothetical protein [Pseudomonadota bacterium]